MKEHEAIILEIILEQEAVIGPLALQQANAVDGLEVNLETKEVKLSKDGVSVLSDLVEEYRTLFGNISVEVCRSAVRHAAPNIPSDLLPAVLKG